MTIILLDDWLEYFDNGDFFHSDTWAGCYCMGYHWREELVGKKPWDCTKSRGIASQLLDKVCSDAFDDGYEYVEAYPFVEDDWVYHGTKSMYEKSGFEVCGEESGCTIVRKYP